LIALRTIWFAGLPVEPVEPVLKKSSDVDIEPANGATGQRAKPFIV
jgi:hypothetical protein